MNWTTFLLTLTLIYLAYFGVNLLYDLLSLRKPPKEKESDEILFFEEDIKPQLIIPKEEQQQDMDDFSIHKNEVQEADGFRNHQVYESFNPMQSTGAVALKELFNLAKNDLIEYTGAINY